jgi:hypothetical protein
MTAARLLVFTAIWVSGCAFTAVRPPSPAAVAPPEVVQAAATARYPPGDRFYVAIFGSQRTPPMADCCHTWATLLRVSDGAVVERFSVSWMPATLDIDPQRLSVEPGVNLPHEAAVTWATADGQHVVGWGPYELTAAGYHRFRLQADWLEAGGTAYQSVDTVGEAGRTGAGTNCIHALTDLRAEFGRLRYPLVAGYGTTAGWWAAWRLRQFGSVVGGPDAGLRAEFGDGVRWR